MKTNPVVVIAKESFVPECGDASEGLVADPGLHHDVVAELEFPLQKHFLPDNRCETCFSD
jgi:hypothetical protein